MKRRGRPPHPDILTPREWEVLALLRDGLSNPEIAERLGVSRDAVKYHVSEILTKLGVPDRSEAANWERSARPWSAAARGVLAWPAAHLSLIAKGAAIGTIGVTAAGLAVLAYGVLSTAGDSSDESGLEAAEHTAAPFPTLEVVQASDPTPPPSPRYGADIPLPDGVAVIVATGCSGCEAPPDAVVRTYRAENGSIRVDTLISADSAFVPRRTVEFGGTVEDVPPYMTYIDAADDGSSIVVGFCTKGECTGAGAPTADAETILYRTLDQGTSWNELVRLGPREFLAGLTSYNVLIGRHIGGGTAGTESLRWLPTGQTVDIPSAANSRWSPLVIGDGSVAWQTDDGRLADGAGNTIVSVPNASSVRWASAPPGMNPELLALWPDGQFSYGTAGFSRSGEQVLRLSGGVLVVEAWAGDWLAFGHLETPISVPAGVPNPTRLPVLIDLKSGLVCQITEPFSSPPFAGGRNQLLAVETDSSSPMKCDPAPIPSVPVPPPAPGN